MVRTVTITAAWTPWSKWEERPFGRERKRALHLTNNRTLVNTPAVIAWETQTEVTKPEFHVWHAGMYWSVRIGQETPRPAFRTECAAMRRLRAITG